MKVAAIRLMPLFVLVALPVLGQKGTSNMLQLETTIPLNGVEGRIDHLAVDVAGRRLFVAALGNNTVEVIDLSAGTRVSSLEGVKEPQGLAYVPAAQRLFAAGRSDGALSIFDTQKLTLLNAVPLGGNADNIRYDAGKNQIYVGYGNGVLGQFDLTGKLLGQTKLDAHPESFQLETTGKRIFVNLPGSRKVAVLDRESHSTVASWGLGIRLSNFPMALDEKNHRLFVVCRLPPRLVVLNTDTGKEVASLHTVGDSDDVFFDEKRRRIYVIGGEGAIAVISQLDPDHYMENERIPTGEGARTGWYSPQLDKLYVAVRKQGSHGAELRVYAPR
jgi:DNA-binding beta-propeller fold protein YncE